MYIFSVKINILPIWDIFYSFILIFWGRLTKKAAFRVGKTALWCLMIRLKTPVVSIFLLLYFRFNGIVQRREECHTSNFLQLLNSDNITAL